MSEDSPSFCSIKFTTGERLKDSNEGLQHMMDKMQETALEYGMKINIKKTKVMKISKRPGQEFAVFLEGQQLSQVTHFSYLGSLITQE